MIKYLLAIGVLIFTSCRPTTKERLEFKENPSHTSLDYAEGFTVEYANGAKYLTIHQPFQGAKAPIQYVLVNKDSSQLPPIPEKAQVIRIPLNRIICTSTTHIPLLDYLNETSSLVAFPTTEYITSKKTRQRIAEGHVVDLGPDNDMNLELLLSAEPEMVMGYSVTGDMGTFGTIKKAGIPVVLNAEYLEKSPLGRAEWLKFAALFYNKETEADSIFRQIEQKYLMLKDLASVAKERPSVLSGLVYGSTWFLPGGQNYAAQLINDAGGNYLWANDSSTGFLELSFESVYEKAQEANYWIGVGSHASLQALEENDHRYVNFKAFQTGEVFTYHTPDQAGSSYLELGYLRPDLVLHDLIVIMHKDMLSDDSLYFYRRLK